MQLKHRHGPLLRLTQHGENVARLLNGVLGEFAETFEVDGETFIRGFLQHIRKKRDDILSNHGLQFEPPMGDILWLTHSGPRRLGLLVRFLWAGDGPTGDAQAWYRPENVRRVAQKLADAGILEIIE